MSAAARRFGARRAGCLLVVLLALAALTAYVVTGVRIARQQWRDEARPADVIVVFGAAEYVGRPSPIFRARLDQAFLLFQRGLAPYIIVTGGQGDDPHFSEGAVGREYLVRRGVPEGRVIAETQSSNTSQEAERVATIMRANGMRTCLAVSDAYHNFRIKAALDHYQITAYGSPHPELRPLGQRLGSVLREALSYGLWRLHLT